MKRDRSEQILISVIVPVYNVNKYIEKCVSSLINQTYKCLEIILVDDGSTDGSAEICDEIKKRDDRIVVLHKTNGGLSDARNYGVDYSHGELLSFIDGDDYIAPNMYEVMLQRMIDDESEICICNYMKVDENGKKIDEEYSNFEIEDSLISGKDMIKGLESSSVVYFVVAWNKLYRKNLFDNIRYPVGKVHEDEYVAHIIAHNAEKVSCLSEAFYFYVQRKGSITYSGTCKTRRNKMQAYIERFDYVEPKYSDLRNELIWLLADYISNLVIEQLCSSDEVFYREGINEFKKRFRCIIKEGFFEISVSTRFIKCILFYFFPQFYYIVKKQRDKRRK